MGKLYFISAETLTDLLTNTIRDRAEQTRTDPSKGFILLIETLSGFVNIFDELQTGETGQGENVSRSVLRFTPEKEDDQKFLSCRARNELIPNTAVEDQWKITVYCE